MVRGLVKTLGWMVVATTTSITDVLTLVALSAIPAFLLAIPLGVVVPMLGGLAGAAVTVGATHGRRKFTDGFVFQRDTDDAVQFTTADLVVLTVYNNVVLLLAALAGAVSGAVAPETGLVTAVAYAAIDITVGSRRWYLSPGAMLTTVLSRLAGHGVELATLLNELVDTNEPLLHRLRPRT